SLERYLHESNIVSRLHARGMTAYLGFYVVNLSNTQTPLAEWFDDASWNNDVVPAVTAVARPAHALGFDGMALDQELYPQEGGSSTGTWDWDYPGHQKSQADVRAAARARGTQFMDALAAGFPHVPLLAYASTFPETWDELVQQDVNDISDANADSVNIDF